MRFLALLLLVLLPSMGAALEINTATRAELERIQGLGVATTERILQARSERPFADWDDLAARVAGIGGKRAKQLRRQGLTVNGRPTPADRGKRQ
jgi:competence protein ComEA